MKKSVLRKEMKLLRKSMDKNDRTAKDKKIFENLIKLDSFKSSSWFYVYVSYGTEADTKNLIEYLFELKKEREKVLDISLFKKLVRDSFSYNRKTIRNNLKSYDLKIVESVLLKHAFDLGVRAEALSLNVFVELANALFLK